MRNYILFTLSMLLTGTAIGQVKGVSYTIAPSVSYNWFGGDSGLDDAFMFGGRVGFGFGEYVELRATYMQTIDLNTDFAGLGLDSTFSNQGVDLSRYGAELKLNIGRGRLLPYLIVGGGIQDQERDGLGKSENIFGTLGLGLTLSAADRYAFGVEGKYIAYSGNAIRNLVDSLDRPGNPDLGSDNIGTFALAANLSFYLGGRRPGQLSEVDEEYMRTFQGGLGGLSIPIELGGARVDWDGSLPYRDAYFAGGTAGFSFGPLISLRGFYYQGMKDDEINFDFDDIALYGADVRFNLTQASTGLVPYLSIGGGYIDLADGYNDNVTEAAQFASSQGFASGGGGLYIKFNDRFKLNGGVKALLTTGADLEDLDSRDQITTSYMYNAGLGFTLGGRSKTPDAVRRSTMEDKLDAQDQQFERRSDSIRNANQKDIADIRDRYQDSIARLDKELSLALKAGDTESAEEIQQERDNAAAIVKELDNRSDAIKSEVKQEERAEIDAALGRQVQPVVVAPNVTARPGTPAPSTATGSVLYLESQQIDRLIDAIGNRNAAPVVQPQGNTQQPAQSSGSSSDQMEQINRRIERLEDMLFQMNSGQQAQGGSSAPSSSSVDQDRIRQLEQRIDRINNQNNGNTSIDEQSRIKELEDQIQSMDPNANGNTKKNLRSTKNSDGADANEQRIRDLEKQLEDRRDNASSNNDDDDERMRDLERRLTDRMSNLRSSDSDEQSDEIRRSMMGDMADYQKDLMEEVRDLQRDLDRANQQLTREQAKNSELDLERDRLREERRAARLAAATTTTTDSVGNVVVIGGTRSLGELEVNSGGVYLADNNTDGFFSNFTYTGMSGTVGFNFGDATGLGLGLRWHYKLGPTQRAEFMPEAYFGIGSPTTFGIFGNIVYPFINERSESTGLIPYGGIGIGAMQIKDSDDSDQLNFRPAINLLVGTYLPVANGRVFVDFSTRNFFSVNQLTGGYRFNF